MFISLHTHSDHSLKDGFQTVKDMLSYASALGQTAIALTDHGTMSGCGEGMRFADDYGIKFIPGCEHYLANDLTIKDKQVQHIVLLAMNATGYRNLNIITTLAHRPENFYRKPRIDMDMLRKYNEGIICTTACIAGCQEKAKELKEIFGDRLYIEIHTNSLKDQKPANKHWLEIADKYDIPFYAAQDAHYTVCTQAEAQRSWTPYDYDNGDGQGYDVCDDYFLHTEEEVRRALSYLPQDVVDLSIKNTEVAANRCTFKMKYGEDHYPKSKYADPKLEVRRRVWAGCKEKGVDKDQHHIDQIKHEIDILGKVNYFDYFLLVSDLINWCKQKGIRTGVGRGSVVGSDVAYMMGITGVDPLAHKLIFERFAHTQRVSPPDIDTDVPRGRRQEVIQHIKDEYGQVYQVVTFGHMDDKAAIKRAAKALMIDHTSADKLCKQYDSIDAITNIPQVDKKQVLDKLQESEFDLWMGTARQFKGKIQNYGTHASAVVVLTTDPYDFCAVERFKDDQYNLNYEFHDLEAMGLLKLDILGLETLDVIDECLDLIPATPKIDLSRIPPDDHKAFELLQRGYTDGIFQLESPMMGRLIQNIKPESIDDVNSIVALGRPGPLQAGVADTYIAGRVTAHGK